MTKEAITSELKQEAELFSGNVVLRGPFQETILPNIAFVGGGGELAYWLEMKRVYEAIQLPYPVLLLRNSFLLLRAEQEALLKKLALEPVDLFMPLHKIQDLLLDKKAAGVDLSDELSQLSTLYEKMQAVAGQVDATLINHTSAIEKQALNKVNRLVTKMKTAQRKKLTIESGQIKRLKDRLFPGDSLQERTENIAGFYADYGPAIFDIIKRHSLSVEQQFGVIYLPEITKHNNISGL